MKTKIAVLLLSLSLSFEACNRPDEVADDRAAIKSISFEGVPAQNVTIDRARSTIIIQLPTDLREGLKPSLELSEGASVVGGLTADGLINLTPYCYCSFKGVQSQIVVDKEVSNSSFKYRRSYLMKVLFDKDSEPRPAQTTGQRHPTHFLAENKPIGHAPARREPLHQPKDFASEIH